MDRWKIALLLISIAIVGIEIKTAISASGDYATMGYDEGRSADVWRVDSNGNFIPGTTDIRNIGSSSAKVANITIGGQMALESATATQLKTIVPISVGALIFNSSDNVLCVSSAAVVDSWVFVSSTTSNINCAQ